MKINWKVRLKNPTTWVTLLPTLVTFIYSVLSAFDIFPTISEETVVNLALGFVSGLSAIGVLVDPTTKGLGDGEVGLSYNEPM